MVLTRPARFLAGGIVIGLVRAAVQLAGQLLQPLLEKNPEAYAVRMTRRYATRYVTFSVLSKRAPEEDRLKYAAKAVAARAVLLHYVNVSPAIVEELDLAIHLQGG